MHPVPKNARRKVTRLADYDYRQPGAYFVTIRFSRPAPCIGEITGDAIELSPYGRLVQACWDALPQHYPTVTLDACVVMPDHFHGIVVLNPSNYRLLPDGSVGAGLRPAPTDATHTSAANEHRTQASATVSLTEVVRAFKSFSARAVNQARHTPGAPLWQRGYYEHIIRNEDDLNRIREYIRTNPLRRTLRFTADGPTAEFALTYVGGNL